jgi:hypothetical protein
MKHLTTAVLVAAALSLSGCASTPAQPREEPFSLRLSPASLGGDLALQQRVTVTAMGRSQQMDVAVEADAESVRFAVLDLGQTVARLEWDGHAMKETRPAGWPAVVTGQRVLGDLQMVYWPADAIRSALPEGWSLQADEQGRTVRSLKDIVMRVRYPSPGTAELENIPGGYSLRMDRWPDKP